MERPVPLPVGPGQESVWDYPRPPSCVPAGVLIEIMHEGVLIASTTRAWKVCETSHPPTYYLPADDLAPGVLQPSGHRPSFCEWKGVATYWNVHIHGEVIAEVAWSYANPTAPYAPIRDHLAFYPDRFESITVNGEDVIPQPGGFYGGWITSNVVGPFKGIPGSRWW
jgi:uncharacterized protein (DUF427 family)